MKIVLCLSVAAVGLLVAAAAPAAAGLANSNVEMVLEGAASRGGADRSDLTLEFQVREGEWIKTFRGRTFRMNQGRHTGTIRQCDLRDGAGKLAVDVQVRRDYWSGGGRGGYAIQLARAPDGKGLTGTYSGTFTATEEPPPLAPPRGAAPVGEGVPAELRGLLESTGPAQPAEAAKPKDVETVQVSGNVTATLLEPWPELVPGHQPVAPGEHPRLIFRKADLPRLKKLAAETPEGLAIMKRFWAVVEQSGRQDSDKFTSWPGVGYGFAYVMTGEQKHADKAKGLMLREFFDRAATGGQDIHHGPRLVGLALTYDLCYDGWDEAFRLRCAEEIRQRVLELASGTFGGRTMGGFNPNWWSNHNGIRAGAAGLGALAILGEKGANGPVLPAAGEIADQMAWEVRGYVRDGLGGGGWSMEGMFYKGMTIRRGLMQFIRAWPLVTGRKVLGPTLGDFLIAGYFVEAAPGGTFPQVEKFDGTGADMSIDGEPLDALVWSLGMPAVPQDMLPAARYLLDRAAGPAGDSTFGITQGFYAPFALAGYPFGVTTRPPGECLRWASPDPRNGHWVFRPVWNDADDILMTLNLQSRVLGGCHYERTGIMSGWRLAGFGQTWLDGRYHPVVKGRGEAVADKNGPRTVDWKLDGRTLVMALDIAPAYMPPVEVKVKTKPIPYNALAQKQGGLGAHWLGHPWSGALVDYGVRGRRHVAVDCSGAGGAPILVAIVEDIGLAQSPDAEPAPAEFAWRLPLTLRGADLRVDGKGFTVTRQGASLAGVVLADGPLDDTAATHVKGGRLLAVFTLQKGAAPPMTVDGDGLAAKVTVGKRTVRFAGGSLRLE